MLDLDSAIAKLCDAGKNGGRILLFCDSVREGAQSLTVNAKFITWKLLFTDQSMKWTVWTLDLIYTHDELYLRNSVTSTTSDIPMNPK